LERFGYSDSPLEVMAYEAEAGARDVRFGAEADIGRITRSLRRLRLIVTAARQDQAHEPTGHLQSAQGTADVRSWSKVDISQRKRHVRFTPD
jgi:hypothetical protein